MSDYDVDGLDWLEKTLIDMTYNKYPKEFEAMMIKLAYELQGATKEKTPVKTNRLRSAWRVGKVKRKGDEIFIEVYNNVEYAEFVEYGHRVGENGYKEGEHMLEISLKEIESKLTPYLKSWINNFIEANGL